jgi:hypothetical protein
VFHGRDHAARFDRWSRRYEASWLQRVIFDPVHAVVLAELEAAPPTPTPAAGPGHDRDPITKIFHRRDRGENRRIS